MSSLEPVSSGECLGKARKPNKAMTYNPQNVSVALGVCSIDTLSNQTMADIVSLISTGIIKSFNNVVSTLLPHARNKLVNQIFANHPNFTHILFIDADQCGFDKRYVELMLAHDVDVIAGVTVTRNRDNGRRKLTFVHKDKTINLEEDLFEVKHTGFFFTMVRREVFEATGETLPNGTKSWFRLKPSPRSDYDPHKFAEDQLAKFDLGVDKLKLFKECIRYGEEASIGGEDVGEDVFFCRQARDKGFRCWIDTRLQVDHMCLDRISVKGTLREYDLELLEWKNKQASEGSKASEIAGVQ